MAFMASFTRLLAVLSLLSPSLAWTKSGSPQQLIEPYDRQALQTNVTWDNHSLFVQGRRILFYSGEFHPFRLPVPGLWLDVFQKIRAMGYTGVSFYVDWALVEGKPGEINMEGVFALDPFFEAAKKAGIYLLARPGPYINAEVSGGGFPGWLQRSKGHLRTAEPEFLARTDLYVQTVGGIIAKAQITNGGPVILVQPENEYSHGYKGFKFPDPAYFDYVKDQYRKAGIVVPFLSNDAGADGNNAPGKPGAVDIYGHDGYPLGFDCSKPDVWPAGKLPTNWWEVHQNQSSTTPYSIPEFQGGSFDPWGGKGFDSCASLLNSEFERVFYKNDYSFGVTIFNIYMIFGGTNWGNLGHPGGYSSYDYGSVITEDRLVSREKYSEAKLQANFLVASSSYLTAVPRSLKSGGFVTSNELTVTHLQSNRTNYLVVRHTDYSSTNSTSYKLLLGGTSGGDITIPQAGGSLTLHGRDSKIHVVDYDIFGIDLLYSTAEIFTKQWYGDNAVLVVYSGPDEQHEMAVALSAGGKSLPKAVTGKGIQTATVNGNTVLSWKTSPDDRALKLGPLTVWFLDRQSAYKWWVLPLTSPGQTTAPYTRQEVSSVIIKGGYLMRTAYTQDNYLMLTGDIDNTTTIEIIAGAPEPLNGLLFNNVYLQYKQDPSTGIITATIPFKPTDAIIPDLSTTPWHYIDSLPEIKYAYKDDNWFPANVNTTDNTFRNVTTPTSLYSSDYGYHAGTLLYRGHFRSNGREKSFTIRAQGGSAFGFSTWLNDRFLGSFIGTPDAENGEKTFHLPKLRANGTYVVTVVLDNMGYDENWVVGRDDMKSPRGILDYELDSHLPSDVTWKITGNFGGENYVDKVRGPLNEGGMWAERHGFHLPGAHTAAPATQANWKESKGPTEGIKSSGIAWYVTNFDLNLPRGYDIPLAIAFGSISTTPSAAAATGNGTTKATSPAYRLQLYVNGWQFGKYIHHIGPQTRFPVPEGIWDYRGKNWIAISLWAMEEGGAKVESVKLVAGPVIQTGYPTVQKVNSAAWAPRSGVF